MQLHFWTVCADEQVFIYSHRQFLQPGKWYRFQTDLSPSSLNWKHWPIEKTLHSYYKQHKCNLFSYSVLSYPMLSQRIVYFTNWQWLTSKGLLVALATPWTSLLLVLDPLLTCGPAPRRCCSTLKASPSPVFAAADCITTAEWTRLLVLARRISPTDSQEKADGYGAIH